MSLTLTCCVKVKTNYLMSTTSDRLPPEVTDSGPVSGNSQLPWLVWKRFRDQWKMESMRTQTYGISYTIIQLPNSFYLILSLPYHYILIIFYICCYIKCVFLICSFILYQSKYVTSQGYGRIVHQIRIKFLILIIIHLVLQQIHEWIMLCTQCFVISIILS